MDEEVNEGTIKRLRNLKHYKDMSDDEIRQALKDREAPKVRLPKSDEDYDKRFKDKIHMLQTEFGLDMNDSNDREMINNLVRQMLQSETADKDIRSIQERQDKNKEDIATLKAYGDFQRDLQITIADLQDKLGISRKVRKEKSVDDIPQFIDGLLSKAASFWERKTIMVDCPRCKIELVRYWLNFPDKTTLASFTTQCPHCGETVTYNG